jgi:hypothetical protein
MIIISVTIRKRRRASALLATPHTLPAALPAPPTDRRLSFGSPLNRKVARVTRLALGSHLSGNRASPTPVPKESCPQVPAFTTLLEQRDFLTPLVPAGQSLWRAFINHFG